MDILVKEEHLARAFELHRMNPVVDAHLDLAGEVLLRRQAGEKEVVKRHYLPHFKEAGLNLVFLPSMWKTGIYTGHGKMRWSRLMR